MKRIKVIGFILVIGLLVLGGTYFKIFEGGTIVTEHKTVEVEKQVVVDSLDKQIKDAQEAKSDAIREAGDKAKLDAETKMRNAIELEVRQAYRVELEKKETELEKKTGF